MLSRWSIPVLMLIGTLCLALLSIATNLASSEIQDWLQTQSWYSMPRLWLLIAFLVVIEAMIALWRHQISTDSTGVQSVLSDAYLKRNRSQMLLRVRHDWIEGVLDQSLYNLCRLDLDLEDRPDAVDIPLTLIVQEAGKEPRSLPQRTKIITVFDDHAGALLILGAPGTGKTTLLLELARDLLDRAEKDESQPIPVVFNLSSWATRRQPLSQWLVAELTERSDVPKQIAQRWIETEQIIPLLDGLDEVDANYRQDCVEAINDFRRDHGLLPIAVCSRIADYAEIGTKLHMQNAVLIQPLSKSCIQSYLKRGGESIQALRTAVENEPSLLELLETPLMLWVAILAYSDANTRIISDGTLEDLRKEFFDAFVTAMLKRRGKEIRYSREQTVLWLRLVALSMVKCRRSVFSVQDLSGDWLYLVAQSNDLSLSFARVNWTLRLIFGLLGLISGMVSVLICVLFPNQISELIGYLIVSLVALSVGIFDLIGLRFFGLIVGLRVGLISGLISGVVFGLIFGPISALRFGLIAGLMFVLFVVLGELGYSCLTHWILRFLFWRAGYAPWRYVRFLDYATQRVFLRKTGGGYIFIHRMLMEHFASLHG